MGLDYVILQISNNLIAFLIWSYSNREHCYPHPQHEILICQEPRVGLPFPYTSLVVVVVVVVVARSRGFLSCSNLWKISSEYFYVIMSYKIWYSSSILMIIRFMKSQIQYVIGCLISGLLHYYSRSCKGGKFQSFDVEIA